jgi:hypothetical protein
LTALVAAVAVTADTVETLFIEVEAAQLTGYMISKALPGVEVFAAVVIDDAATPGTLVAVAVLTGDVTVEVLVQAECFTGPVAIKIAAAIAGVVTLYVVVVALLMGDVIVELLARA